MVRAAGLEPARPYGLQILSLMRLPISPCPRRFVLIYNIIIIGLETDFYLVSRPIR